MPVFRAFRRIVINKYLFLSTFETESQQETCFFSDLTYICNDNEVKSNLKIFNHEQSRIN
jgi:hypothetical protein